MNSHGGIIPSRKEAMVLVLLALPLIVTAATIEAADWVDGLPSLIAVVAVSLVGWALLARSRIPWWIGHPVALILGLLVALILGAFTISEANGIGDLFSLIGSWFGAIGSQEGNRGAAITGIWLLTVTLWMGHFTVWFSYRRSFALLAALPGFAVLLVVLTFLPSDYYWYFFMYLLAAAPGIAYRYNGYWGMDGRRVPLVGTLVVGAVLMVVTLAPVWRAPAPEGTVISLSSALEEPWYSFREEWSGLFHGVPSRQEWPFFSPPIDLAFKRPVGLGEEMLFEVESERPHRWRMRVYETYTSKGWISNEEPVEMPSTEVPLNEYVQPWEDRTEVKIGVRMHSKANALMSVGEPLSANIPSRIEMQPQTSFTLYLEGYKQVDYLPQEMRSKLSTLGPRIRASEEDELLLLGRAVPADSGLFRASTLDLREMGFKSARADDSNTAPTEVPHILVERTESSPAPPVALLGQRVLVPPKQYKTVGSISVAEPRSLRLAGQDYPLDVTDRYLQLPHDFPETVEKLAEGLTADANNPYDKAEAIRRYLTTLPYTLDFVSPPEGRDWVEHFLFVERRGFCQNYASAMITMLRSLGIPARLVVGFAPGLWDDSRGVAEIQSRHYHAWPEVYFPRYGWVEFEPTPVDVQPSLEALGFRPVGTSGEAEFDPEACFEQFATPEGCIAALGATDNLQDLIEALDSGPAALGNEELRGGGGLGFSALLWTVLALGVAIFLVLPVGVVSYVQGVKRRLGFATVTYTSMWMLGRLSGVARRPYDTAWEYSQRLTRTLPDHTRGISRITQGFVAARYGPSGEMASEERAGIKAAWSRLRTAMIGRILLRFVSFGRRRRSVYE